MTLVWDDRQIMERKGMPAALMRRLKQEVAILKEVKHPCIVDLKEVLSTDDHIYLVFQVRRASRLSTRAPTRGAASVCLRERMVWHERVYWTFARSAQPLSRCRVVGNAADDGRRGMEARGAAE